MSIPTWFYEEHEKKSICKGQMDYESISNSIDELEQGLKEGWKETQVQQYLSKQPEMFDGLYRHGHGTFGFYELSFGGKYYADWLWAHGHSGGLLWDLIELECPQSIPFKRNGHFSDATRKGVEQIQDWRRWIKSNIRNVQSPVSNNGMGLYDLDSNAQGIVVVGRREIYGSNSDYDQNRKNTTEQNRINVISYETLIEKMRFRINA